jgi:hypothetical protein
VGLALLRGARAGDAAANLIGAAAVRGAEFERLGQIMALKKTGLTLAQIQRLMARVRWIWRSWSMRSLPPSTHRRATSPRRASSFSPSSLASTKARPSMQRPFAR